MTNKLLDKIKKVSWTKSWTGKYTLISCTLFGYHYTKLIKNFVGLAIDNTIIIYHQGICSSYLPEKELSGFGKGLVAMVEKDSSLINTWANGLKQETDKILKLFNELQAKDDLNEADFLKFVEAYYHYANFHFIAKRVVDFLPPQILGESMAILQEARKYSEPVYEQFEEIINYFVKFICSSSNYEEKLIACLTSGEVLKYFKNKNLPEKQELEERLKSSAVIFKKGKFDLITGQDVENLEKILTPIPIVNQNKIKGIAVFPGKTVGIVKIVLDPRKASDFNEENILVANMTRPDYLQLMKKAKAFITDAGGMLCHAAITARELKKPCIVGTEVATKILKDGDMVEVDANNGIVKILKS